MSEQDLEAFWRICRQIEILELTDMKIENIWAQSSHNSPSQAGHGLPFEEQLSTSAAHSLNSGTSTNWSTSAATTTRTVRLPKLRELTLDGVTMDAEQQLKQIILHCPLLQNLNWKSGYSDHVMGQFCDYLAARTWACLDWIEIKREERYVTDQEHALLLQSAPRPFRRLDVNVGLFGEQTFRLYREYGHFTTLTKIDLRPSMALSLLSLPGSSVITVFSRRVQEVLESCPALEHIAALMITAQDIIQGKPWVCFRLKKFEVMINMQFSDNSRDQKGLRTRLKYSEDDRVLCHQIFERLGQLSQLAVLDMRPRQEDWIHHFDIKTTSLPLRLRMGLRYLSTLRNIEMIGCYGSQKVRLGDLEWMLQHWNKLQKIVGDSLSVKWSRVRRGELDERSKLVMKNLNARDVQLTLDIDARRYTASGELEAYYGTESESESENVMQAK
ncbi:hypothetical protein BGX31_002041 [Mortierella sp. GBA43]|nr:hypothetical protein BGX31_002041 [Mortierella sp. GBA43]